MKELVYANGTQVDTEAKKESVKKKSNGLGALGAMGMVTAAVAAFNALAQTDLDSIIEKAIDLTKQPVLAVAVIAAYALSVVMARD